MKTKLVTAVLSFLMVIPAFAQDRTTVNAMSSEVSDNLDLRAVASIFGDSRDLEDFEYRLNDPKSQISNLDLNNDNRVDYLRVIESVEGNTHLVIVQSVLGMDSYQDVATIEVERGRNNQVSVQVVGDVYMYGANYIYEPVYVHTPVIYASFWVRHYRPYCSTWYWGYYPSYYTVWAPYPVFRYRNNVNVWINFHHHYNYVNIRRSERAVVLHNVRRANYCERNYPTRSFAYRNTNYKNRYELDQTRNIRNVSTRNQVAYSNPGANVRNTNNATPKTNGNVRSNQTYQTPRTNQSVRSNSDQRDYTPTVRNESNSGIRQNQNNDTPRNNQSVRSNTNQREYTPVVRNESNSGIRQNPSNNTPRNDQSIRMNGGQRDYNTPRQHHNNSNNVERQYSQRSESNSRPNTVRQSQNENRGSINIAQNRMENRGNMNQSRGNSQQRNPQGNVGSSRNNEQRGGRR